MEHIQQYDIILFSETWIHQSNAINLEIENYHCEHIFGQKHSKGSGRCSGGISIYYKSFLKEFITILHKNNNGIIWIKLDSSLFQHNNDVFICHSYRRPSNTAFSQSDNYDFFDSLESDIVKYDNLGYTFVTGDLNCRTADEIDFLQYDKYLDASQPFLNSQNDILSRRCSKDKIIDAAGRSLINLCLATGFVIGNGRLGNDENVGGLTFCSKMGVSTVDYILLRHDTFPFISDFTVNNFNEFSDHACLSFCLNIEYDKRNNIASEDAIPTYETKICFDPDKVPLFQGQLMNNCDVLTRLTASIHTDPIDHVVNDFTNFMFTTAEPIFGKTMGSPSVSNPHKNKSWFDHKCYDDKKKFKCLRNKYNRSKTITDRNIFIHARAIYNKTKRIAYRRYRKREGIRINNLAKTNPRKFWKEIRGNIRKNTNSADTLTKDDLYVHFKNMYGSNDVDGNDVPFINTTDDVINTDVLDRDIDDTEIRTAVLSQNNNKSPGLDKLPCEIFKSSLDFILPFLKSLYNYVLHSNEYPQSWGLGIIAPVFKKGDINDAKNYRGITLINIIAKIYSQILLNRLNKWTSTNEKLTKHQFGFQTGKSISDCIFILKSIISKTLSEKEKLYCIFIDYQQFFDRINHSYLWHKLLSEKVSQNFVNALKAMYSCVKSCVRYQSSLSPFFDIFSGVKQGDPSSPLLAMFFINDLINNVNSNLPGVVTLDDIRLFLLFYADDMVLLAKSPESLSKMLKDVETYCNTWGLKINVMKTKAMIFENGRTSHYDFKIYNNSIEQVESFKYLGINLFKNGNFNRSQKLIAQHASFSLYKLYQIFENTELPVYQKIKLFDSLVGSTLNFCSEVWGIHPATDVEMIHVRFLRSLLGVKKSTNLSALYGELGRVPLIIYRKINMIKYWEKILTLSDGSLVKKTYEILRTDAINNKTHKGQNWASQIKTILDQHGFSNIWISENIDDYTFEIIRRRILDNYYQTWYSGINDSPRLRSYALFKHSFNREKYLDIIHENKFRYSLARFRTSSHRLAIETGRFTNININERICRSCSLNQVESEYHFLLVCPKYRELRFKYFKPYFCHWPTLNKFQLLLNSTCNKTLYNLAKFIYFAFKDRETTNQL